MGKIQLLWHDKLVLLAVLFLIAMVSCALLAPLMIEDVANKMNLRQRNSAPTLDAGWLYWMGADQLGRPILPRIMTAAQNTLLIAASAVALSLTIGSTIGLIAGYARGWTEMLIMRAADILMSFPSLLLAVIVLYVFEPHAYNVVIVLAITRLPIYIRTTRAEVMEIRERTFVQAASVLGASPWRLITRHIAPVTIPTLVTVATLDFAFVMLAESALSFLGIGIQPPDVTWGLMVAQGRNYLASAWWLAFFPGLAIMLTTLSLNLLSSWLRMATDPAQSWRVEGRG